VEGVRQDVLVLVTSYLNTDWFVRQIIRRPVRPYDAAKGPPVYRGREWPMPKGSPLKMTLGEADSIPPYYEVRERQQFTQRNLVATIEPGYLTRDQIIVLRLIKDAYPERPLYFSTGGYGRGLGLTNYTLRQGLAEKLVETPIVPSRDTVKVADGYVDVSRTQALWNIYKAPASLIRRGDWVDRPSYGIPYTYAVTGIVLADALRTQARAPEAEKVMRTVEGIAKAARLDDILTSTAGGG
jgi:hypothetical protein